VQSVVDIYGSTYGGMFNSTVLAQTAVRIMVLWYVWYVWYGGTALAHMVVCVVYMYGGTVVQRWHI